MQDADQKLQEKIDELEQELQQEKLEKIIDKLARIKSEEVDIHASTVELQDKVLKEEPWSRRDLSTLVQAQDRQKSALLDTAGVLQEVEQDDAKVFSYALKIITDRMEESHARLMEKETSVITQKAQERAIVMLGDLVDALKEEAQKKKKKEEESGGGGGGGGGGGPEKLIPPMAELKMLRSMQTEILQSTAKVGDAAREAQAVTPEIEAEAQRIGRDQKNVKKLMEELTDPNADQQGGAL